LPSRNPPLAVLLRVRHPKKAPMKKVTVNGKPWQDFDVASETVRLAGCLGKVAVEIRY
jgi:hypothetical protein